MPTQPEASTTRERSNVCMRPLKPEPSSPSRWSTGTNASSRNSSVLTMPRSPSFFIGGPKRRPSVSRSSTNAVTPLLREPGSVCANTT